MSSASTVFFIQNGCSTAVSNTNSIPAEGAISFRYMRPICCCAGVAATSTVTGTSPPPLCKTTRGSLAQAETLRMMRIASAEKMRNPTGIVCTGAGIAERRANDRRTSWARCRGFRKG